MDFLCWATSEESIFFFFQVFLLTALKHRVSPFSFNGTPCGADATVIAGLATLAEPGSTFWLPQSASQCDCQLRVLVIWHQRNTANYGSVSHSGSLNMNLQTPTLWTALCIYSRCQCVILCMSLPTWSSVLKSRMSRQASCSLQRCSSVFGWTTLGSVSSSSSSGLNASAHTAGRTRTLYTLH